MSVESTATAPEPVRLGWGRPHHQLRGRPPSRLRGGMECHFNFAQTTSFLHCTDSVFASVVNELFVGAALFANRFRQSRTKVTKHRARNSANRRQALIVLEAAAARSGRMWSCLQFAVPAHCDASSQTWNKPCLVNKLGGLASRYPPICEGRHTARAIVRALVTNAHRHSPQECHRRAPLVAD
jgi:hypothetical protein